MTFTPPPIAEKATIQHMKMLKHVKVRHRICSGVVDKATDTDINGGSHSISGSGYSPDRANNCRGCSNT